MNNEIVQYQNDTGIEVFSPENIKNQVQLIQQVMKDVMKEDTHYGKIPGCGDKPTLLKPGAEKLVLTFRLSPTYDITIRQLKNDHREYEIVCTLTHIPTNTIWGQGVGLCTSMESKFRYRTSKRTCPKCNQETIIEGKKEFGGGWLCWKKQGGCGVKFSETDVQITAQKLGQVENQDIADSFNTILKIAKKRALVDATLTVTCASDIFAQDLEDLTPKNEPVTTQPDIQEPIKTETIPEQKTDSQYPNVDDKTKATINLIQELFQAKILTNEAKDGFLKRVEDATTETKINTLHKSLSGMKK